MPWYTSIYMLKLIFWVQVILNYIILYINYNLHPSFVQWPTRLFTVLYFRIRPSRLSTKSALQVAILVWDVSSLDHDLLCILETKMAACNAKSSISTLFLTEK